MPSLTTWHQTTAQPQPQPWHHLGYYPLPSSIFLHITGKRADGYHDLQTLFRLVNWGDAMRFEPLARQFVLADYLATKAHIKTESTKKKAHKHQSAPYI